MDSRNTVLRALQSPDVRKALSDVILQEWNNGAFYVTGHILPGGKAPIQENDGDFAVHARAIVAPYRESGDSPTQYKTLFDFEHYPQDVILRNNIQRLEDNQRIWHVYPDESVLVGIGVTFSLPPFLRPVFTPRHSLASKLRMSLVPIDVDSPHEYAVLIVNTSGDTVTLHSQHQLGWLRFQPVISPRIEWQ